MTDAAVTAKPAIRDCLVTAVKVSLQTCEGALRRPPAEADANDALRARQLRVLWRLSAAYRDAAEGKLSLSELLARLAGALSGSRDTLMLWVDAIESIIQQVEALYGPAPGLGRYKAEQVKAAVLYALDQANDKVPESRRLLSRGSIEMAVSWVIDGVVLVLNRHGLWDLDPGDGVRIGWWFRLRMRLAVLILNVLGTLHQWVDVRAEMLPQVRVIAQKTTQQWGGDLLARMHDVSDFALWAIENRRQLLALLDLATTAVIETEAFAEMSGPEKQAYARELILLVIQEEWGDWPDSPALDALMRAVIDFAIDSAVRIFNKRGLFSGKPQPIPASNPAVAAQASAVATAA